MNDDAEVLRLVQVAFAACPRPEHFTDYTHCSECREHDDLLRSRELDTLTIEDVGSPGWDPICFISSKGFAYLFPALTRLSLSEPSPILGWYPAQLLFHLIDEGRTNRHRPCFSPEQRRAVVRLLRHLAETRRALADEYLCSGELLSAIDLWSGESLDDKTRES